MSESTIAEDLIRPQSPALDRLLGRKFDVLDQGFIRVIDYMGNDAAIVQAARVSYGKGTKKVSEDRGLIRFLMRHRHTSPFEQCEIKFHVRVPMDCWRQWIRHRMSNTNEYSTRYSEAIDATQKTFVAEWRLQSEANKQGSGGYLIPLGNDTGIAENLCREEEELHQHSRDVYEHRLGCGIAREQARKDLPLSTYTEAYWKIDLHNLLHFLSLRMDAHAQLEIRSYANIIGNEIVKVWCPLVWEAFEDYRLKALSLTRIEIEILEALQLGSKNSLMAIAVNAGMLDENFQPIKNSRERAELEEKFKRIGILALPWQK